MILTCGEAVVDLVPTKDNMARDCFLPTTGGAAVNTAIALARLGQSVGFWGGLSKDSFGQLLLNALVSEGVDVTRLTPQDAPSTLAFVHPRDTGNGFSFFDADSAGRSLSAAQLPSLEGITALVAGGISLVHRPAAGAFEALVSMAGTERLVLLDPNIRPEIIEDSQSYRERLGRMMAMADIIKLSDDDIVWLHPDPPEVLLSGRASVVVHTHGAEGATLFCRHGTIHLTAPVATALDTVGAGDVFVAAFMAALCDADVLPPARLALASANVLQNALAFAIKAATFSVTETGANAPYLKDLT